MTCKQRCRHSTWTLPFLAGSLFTQCRVEQHTELPSVYVGTRVGGKICFAPPRQLSSAGHTEIEGYQRWTERRGVFIEPKVHDCSFRLQTTLPFPTHLGPLDLYLVITPQPIHTVLTFTIATGSIYLGDPGVDRHHLIKQFNPHCIFHSSWSHALLPSCHGSMQFVWILKHSCRAFIDPRNIRGSSQPGSRPHPLNLFLCFSSQNRSFSQT